MVQWLVLVVFFGGSMCVTPASGEDSKEVEDVEKVEETDHEEEFVYELEAITVTGSRIKSEEDLTPAPVIVMSRDEIKVRGLASIGDVLQTLTVQSNAINTQANNGGDGSTRISLRGLGAHRTLVLLNGRRAREWRRHFGELQAEVAELPSTSPRPLHWNTQESRSGALAEWCAALRSA